MDRVAGIVSGDGVRHSPAAVWVGALLAGSWTLLPASPRRVASGPTVTRTIDDFTAAGIREAHRQIETGHTTGKIVVLRVAA